MLINFDARTFEKLNANHVKAMLTVAGEKRGKTATTVTATARAVAVFCSKNDVHTDDLSWNDNENGRRYANDFAENLNSETEDAAAVLSLTFGDCGGVISAKQNEWSIFTAIRTMKSLDDIALISEQYLPDIEKSIWLKRVFDSRVALIQHKIENENKQER